jgi:hypothetical protein
MYINKSTYTIWCVLGWSAMQMLRSFLKLQCRLFQEQLIKLGNVSTVNAADSGQCEMLATNDQWLRVNHVECVDTSVITATPTDADKDSLWNAGQELQIHMVDWSTRHHCEYIFISANCHEYNCRPRWLVSQLRIRLGTRCLINQCHYNRGWLYLEPENAPCQWETLLILEYRDVQYEYH